MPILQYLFGVGGALLCLMFALNAYVPKAAPREQHELDRSTIRITARPTGDFVIDHFPAVRNDLAASNDAVKQAMAMMPPEDIKQATGNVARSDPAPAPRKRRPAQRPQQRLANGDAPAPAQSQPWSNGGWSNNGWSSNSWSQGWSNNSSGNWNNNWSHGWGGNRWADN